MTTTITINMDAKCAECGKPGAMESGLCLGCSCRILDEKPMRSERGKALAARIKQRIRRVSMKEMTEWLGSDRDE